MTDEYDELVRNLLGREFTAVEYRRMNQLLISTES